MSSDDDSDKRGSGPHVGSIQPSQDSDRDIRLETAAGMAESLASIGPTLVVVTTEPVVGGMTAGGPPVVTAGIGVGVPLPVGAPRGGHPFSMLAALIPPRR